MILAFSSASGKSTFSTGMGDKFHAEGSMPSSTALLRSMSYTATCKGTKTQSGLVLVLIMILALILVGYS